MRRTTPPHLRSNGRGWGEDEASGFVRAAHDFVDDIRQGEVAPEHADITPGFGTHHPQDVKNLGTLDDPSSVMSSQSLNRANLSKADLEISDAEVRLSIEEGRPPRPGY